MYTNNTQCSPSYPWRATCYLSEIKIDLKGNKMTWKLKSTGNIEILMFRTTSKLLLKAKNLWKSEIQSEETFLTLLEQGRREGVDKACRKEVWVEAIRGVASLELKNPPTHPWRENSQEKKRTLLSPSWICTDTNSKLEGAIQGRGNRPYPPLVLMELPPLNSHPLACMHCGVFGRKQVHSAQVKSP